MRRLVPISLALAAITTGCCSKPKGSSASTPPTVTAAPAPPKRQILMRGGRDTRPEKWTTAEQSRLSAPVYAAHHGFAPQLSEARKADLFGALSEEADAGRRTSFVEGPGLVVCHVAYAGVADGGILKGIFNCTGAELDVEVRAGKLPVIWEHGPEDRNWTYVSVPLVDTSAREAWAFHLLDRDGGASDELGTVRLPARFPTQLKQRDTTLTCRAVDMDDVESHLVVELREVDESIGAVADELKVDATEPSLGLDPVVASLRRSLERLAAWVGWADPRVLRRREWGLRILEALRKDRASFVGRTARTSTRTTAFDHGRGTYRVELVDFRCDARTAAKALNKVVLTDEQKALDVGCILRLAVTNVGDEDLSSDAGSRLGWRLVVARSDGETFASALLMLEGPGVTRAEATGVPIIAPGARGTLVFGLPKKSDVLDDPGKRAALVVMNPFMHSGAVFLSLGASTPARRSPHGSNRASTTSPSW